MGTLLVSLVAVLNTLSLQQVPPAQESSNAGGDFYVLTFDDAPDSRLSLANFVGLVTEGTGVRFSTDPDTQERLDTTPIVLAGQMRLPKDSLLEFARFQLFLRGFGCFGEESSELSIRPVSTALVRLAFPPSEACHGLDERGHAEPVDSLKPFAAPRTGVVLDERKDGTDPLLVRGPSDAEATLLDLDGKPLRSWKDPGGPGGRWDHVLPLRDGDLLCLDSRKESLLRIGPDGKQRWRLALAVHHQAEELADGRILVLACRARVAPAIDPTRRTVDSLVTLVSAEGAVLQEHSVLDMLLASGVALERPRDLDQLPPQYDFDLLHASSLQLLGPSVAVEAESPFQPGRVLVTLRNLDLIALLDLALGRCVWSFGRGRLKNPHDARFLASGNLLVLDGLDPRGGARVIELDPVSERVVWDYKSELHGALWFAGRGTLDARPNGNVFVGLANEAFEVTRSKRLVWRHVNPPPGNPGRLGPRWTRLLPSEAAQRLAPADAPR